MYCLSLCLKISLFLKYIFDTQRIFGSVIFYKKFKDEFHSFLVSIAFDKTLAINYTVVLLKVMYLFSLTIFKLF